MRGPAAAALLATMVACGAPPPAPPTAVIDVTPRAICEGDAFATEVTLSGRRSSARLSLVPDPGDTPLAYRWQLSGAEHVVVGGALDAPALTVRVAGDRPLHATLTVRDPEGGGEATSIETLGVMRCAGCGEAACDAGP